MFISRYCGLGNTLDFVLILPFATRVIMATVNVQSCQLFLCLNVVAGAQGRPKLIANENGFGCVD
jgi:hypothetical protein